MATSMADLASLRDLSAKLKGQSTYRLRFEDDVDRLRRPGALVMEGVVIPDSAACYVAERRQRATQGESTGMYWHVAYAHESQMAVVQWVLSNLKTDGGA